MTESEHAELSRQLAIALVRLIADVETRPILYTDTLRNTQTRRDDLWAITTEQLVALRQFVQPLQAAAAEQAAAAGVQPVAFGQFVGLRHMPAGTTEFYGYLYGNAPKEKCDLYLRPDPRIAEYRELLEIACRQAECEMLLTGDEIRRIRAAIALKGEK